MAGTRTEAAALAAATRFDWDAYSAQFDAGMVNLAASLDRYNQAEAAISAASIECARDLKTLIGEAFK